MKSFALLFVFIASAAFAAERGVAFPSGVYRSPGGTQIVTLALLPNGSYLARWDLDISPAHGRANGVWQLVRDEVRLTPQKEEGGLKGHLTVLLVREMEGRTALLRKEDTEHAKNPFFYFYAKEAPNQAPEPTPGSVTPRAK